MKFRDYLEQAGRRYIPSDKTLEPAFDYLVNAMEHGQEMSGRKKCLDAFLQSQGMDARPKMERTLRLFGGLSSAEKDILILDYAASRDSARFVTVDGALEAGVVLRGFKTAGDKTYDELKARWEMRHRKNGELRQQSVIVDARKNPYLFLEAENILPTFARKYREISESQKDHVLAHLSNLYVLGLHPLNLIDLEGPATFSPKLKSILVSANKALPKDIDYIYSHDIVKAVFPHDEQRSFLLAHRDDLLKKFSSMSMTLGKRAVVGEIAGLAFQGYEFQRFSELSEEEIDAVFRAYSFAWGDASSQNKPYLQFREGMCQSLRDGTVKPWAQTIIEHYRSGSIGGANYRTIEGANAT